MKCVKISKNQMGVVEFEIKAKSVDQIAICLCIDEDDMKKLVNSKSILPFLKEGKQTLPASVRDLLEKICEMQRNAKL